MNQRHLKSGWRTLAASMLAMLASGGVAAESAQPSRSLPSRAEVREQLQKLAPADREARINALRREFDSPSPMTQGRRPNGPMNREARQRMERMRREFQNLSPEERRARLAELRRQGAGESSGRTGNVGASAFSRLTPVQREEFLRLRRRLEGASEEERMAKFREFFQKAGVSMNGAADPSGGRRSTKAGSGADQA